MVIIDDVAPSSMKKQWQVLSTLVLLDKQIKYYYLD